MTQSNPLWKFSVSLLPVLLVLGLTGCQRSSSSTPPAEYVPPTEIPLPTSTVVVVEVKPSSQINCTDVLSYMEDITIPDGTTVKPGEELDKRWQVRNNGTCDWTYKYTIRIIAGDALGSPEIQALYPARSGSAAVIRMKLVAPQNPGTYRTAWQAYNENEEAFGDPVYIDIVVQ